MTLRLIVSIGAVRLLLITELDLLLDSRDGPVVELLVLEHESKLLKSAVEGFRIEKEYDNELKGNPTTVDSQVAPADGGDSNRVNVIREETCELSKDLLDADTAATCSIGPKLDKVCCEEKHESA